MERNKIMTESGNKAQEEIAAPPDCGRDGSQ
jgi:hypothetical protein